MYQCVSGAKDAVVGAMMGGVEMTCTALSGGINTVMGSRMGQMVSSRVGLAVTRPEGDVDQKLPLTETELGECRASTLSCNRFWMLIGQEAFD